MPNFELWHLSQTSDEKTIVNDSLQTWENNIQKIKIVFSIPAYKKNTK